MTDLHVIPEQPTTWRVHEAEAPVLSSEHSSTTGAELAAHAPARDRGAERVVLHDRDDRARAAESSPRRLREGARRARARQLDAARDRARRFARER